MSARPTIIDELLDGPHPCSLTSLEEAGSPYSVVVWCRQEEGRITVNAAEGLWLRNLRRDPRISLVVDDPGPPQRVAEIVDDDGYAHIDSLSRVYEGRPYAYSKPEDVPRFRIAIEPRRIRTLDLPPP